MSIIQRNSGSLCRIEDISNTEIDTVSVHFTTYPFIGTLLYHTLILSH